MNKTDFVFKIDVQEFAMNERCVCGLQFYAYITLSLIEEIFLFNICKHVLNIFLLTNMHLYEQDWATGSAYPHSHFHIYKVYLQIVKGINLSLK